MSENTIQMQEKENPPRKKEEYSTLKITVSISGEPKNDRTCKNASLKRAKPLVKKVEGPFNEQGKIVEEMIEGQEYVFKATEFQESTFTPIKHIWWAEQIDDGKITELEYKKGENPYLDEDKNVCYKYTYKKYAKTKIYAYVWNPEKEASIKIPLIIPKVIITSEITGYTIQELKGLETSKLAIYTPAVVVPTYKANVVLDKGNEEDEFKFSFDLTRDAWYSLGKNEKDEHELLNRAFVPKNYDQNLYGAEWMPSYPNPISATYLPSGLDAFVFTRFGKRTIPAKPLKTQTKLDGTPITSPRSVQDLATDVMIHVGGTYEVNGVSALGGSYGCFGFIQKQDIYATPELAIKASENDDYDDETTNKDWKNTADKIIKLWRKNKKMHILLKYRDESLNYYPKLVIKE